MKRITILTASLIGLAIAQQASADSIEFMCKAKAKEAAAETYKGCVTENKQAEIERIRKEYQGKLNDLKSHYDKELKQLSGENGAKKNKKIKEVTPIETEMAELPAKKLKGNTKVKVQKIDFTASSSTEAGITTDMSDPTPAEIVEFPVE